MLTELDAKAVAQLQSQERKWRWGRFVVLAVGLGIMAVGAWQVLDINRHLLETTRNMSGTEHPTGAEVYFSSVFGGQLAVAYLLPMFGGFVVGHALARWRGSPTRRLLIALALNAERSEGPGA